MSDIIITYMHQQYYYYLPLLPLPL
jgi:hypothetical protein